MYRKLSMAVLLLCMWMPLASSASVEANHATALDLESIKGIGPATAGKILAQRRVKRFESWQDFIGRVPGVGEKKAQRMSDSGLTVNGQRFGAAARRPSTDARGPTLPPDPFPSGSVLVEWPRQSRP